MKRMIAKGILRGRTETEKGKGKSLIGVFSPDNEKGMECGTLREVMDLARDKVEWRWVVASHQDCILNDDDDLKLKKNEKLNFVLILRLVFVNRNYTKLVTHFLSHPQTF